MLLKSSLHCDAQPFDYLCSGRFMHGCVQGDKVSDGGASKFMDEEIPLAIETAEEGTAGIQTWLQAFSDKKQKHHFMTKRVLKAIGSASKSAVLLQDLRDLTKNMMSDESAEDEDVDVPSPRQQEYANAVLDQLTTETQAQSSPQIARNQVLK